MKPNESLYGKIVYINPNVELKEPLSKEHIHTDYRCNDDSCSYADEEHLHSNHCEACMAEAAQLLGKCLKATFDDSKAEAQRTVLKETIDYEEMCRNCKKAYEDQYSGPLVIDYLIVCGHKKDEAQ